MSGLLLTCRRVSKLRCCRKYYLLFLLLSSLIISFISVHLWSHCFLLLIKSTLSRLLCVTPTFLPKYFCAYRIHMRVLPARAVVLKLQRTVGEQTHILTTPDIPTYLPLPSKRCRLLCFNLTVTSLQLAS